MARIGPKMNPMMIVTIRAVKGFAKRKDKMYENETEPNLQTSNISTIKRILTESIKQKEQKRD